jgi:hypothetical protein
MRSTTTPFLLAALLTTICPPCMAGLTAAAQAAHAAASTDPACTSPRMGDFYWEIGDATRMLAGGSQGSGSVDASSTFPIASASKLVFGAYVLQKKGIAAVRSDASLHDGLRFVSGHTDFRQMRCFGQRTVGACYSAGFQGDARPNPATIGYFYYQGGHDQKLAAVDMGLADMDAAKLMRELRGTLHLDESFTMATRALLLAGGMRANADAYARFLRSVMRRELVIGSHLGEDAVCAQPSVCPAEAESSPIQGLSEPWSYSYNHWVESQQGQGSVDAYSSAGAFGFYPWISGDGKFYGVLSRHDRRHARAGVDSVMCGRAIRKAWLGGLAQ